MGNRIGLSSVNPAADIGNGLSGITVDTKPDTSVGHINPSGIALIIGPGNNVSDNKGVNNNAFPDTLGADNGGILVTGTSKGIKIRGNTVGIGEFPLGTPLASKSYGNAGDGIIVTVSDVEIGGTGSGDGNVIAGNARHGIVTQGQQRSPAPRSSGQLDRRASRPRWATSRSATVSTASTTTPPARR